MFLQGIIKHVGILRICFSILKWVCDTFTGIAQRNLDYVKFKE